MWIIYEKKKFNLVLCVIYCVCTRGKLPVCSIMVGVLGFVLLFVGGVDGVDGRSGGGKCIL